MSGPRTKLVIATTLLFLTLATGPQPPRVRAANVTISISNFAFNPSSETVTNGTSITWINNDQVSYTLWFTNQSDNSTITLSDPIPPGGTWTGTFPSGARIKYYDFDRLWITGTIAVSRFPPSQFDLDWADWNNDGKVTILDAAQSAECFDKTNTSPLWPTCKYFDLYQQNKITILDAALVASLFDKSFNTSPYSGQGQPPGTLDPSWKGVCTTLTQPEQNYCNTL